MASTGNRGMTGGMGGTETQQRPTGNFGPTTGQTQGGSTSTGTGGTFGAVKDKAREAASDASDVVSQVKDKAQEFASDVASRAGDAWDTTRQQVQNYANLQYQNSLFSSANTTYQSYTQTIKSGAQAQYTSLANKVFLYPWTRARGTSLALHTFEWWPSKDESPDEERGVFPAAARVGDAETNYVPRV